MAEPQLTFQAEGRTPISTAGPPAEIKPKAVPFLEKVGTLTRNVASKTRVVNEVLVVIEPNEMQTQSSVSSIRNHHAGYSLSG